MPTITIHYEILEYDNIIYVDAENGSDSDGDGSEDNPYETLDKALNEVTSDNNEAIKLSSGKHYISDSSEIFKKSGIDYIGEEESVILVEDATYIDKDVSNIIFIRLIFRPSSNLSENNIIKCSDSGYSFDFEFFNCVFDDPDEILPSGDRHNCYILGDKTSFEENNYNIKFNNCISFRNPIMTTWADDDPNISFINCATTEDKIDCPNDEDDSDEHNILDKTSCLTNVEFDDDYNITSDDDWKNEGTGENPDGSQAHIGVYGGKYAWGNWFFEIMKNTYNNLILKFIKKEDYKYKIEKLDSSGNVEETIQDWTDWVEKNEVNAGYVEID